MSAKVIVDQMGRSLALDNIPQRIISIVPSQTELLVDLGLAAAIVGLTKFCVHPKDFKQSKTVVGGTKSVNLDKIKRLNPDIILCNKEENSLDMIKDLEAIAPVHISDIYTLEDSLELIEFYGALFNCKDQAKTITEEILKQKQTYAQLNSQGSVKRVAYVIWKEPLMLAGSNTFIDDMIKQAGFVNAFASKERYPEVDSSDSLWQKVDEIWLSSEPFPFKEKHLKELEAYFPKKTIKLVDGEMFSWHGSRLLKAFSYFTAL